MTTCLRCNRACLANRGYCEVHRPSCTAVKCTFFSVNGSKFCRVHQPPCTTNDCTSSVVPSTLLCAVHTTGSQLASSSVEEEQESAPSSILNTDRKEPRCREYGCYYVRENGSEFCADHQSRCTITLCGNSAMSHSGLCRIHQPLCRVNGCILRVVPMYALCVEHRRLEDMTRKQTERSKRQEKEPNAIVHAKRKRYTDYVSCFKHPVPRVSSSPFFEEFERHILAREAALFGVRLW